MPHDSQLNPLTLGGAVSTILPFPCKVAFWFTFPGLPTCWYLDAQRTLVFVPIVSLVFVAHSVSSVSTLAL